MARSEVDSAPNWKVDELVRRVDKLERDRWEEKDRRFRLLSYFLLGAIWIANGVSVALAIVHSGH